MRDFESSTVQQKQIASLSDNFKFSSHMKKKKKGEIHHAKLILMVHFSDLLYPPALLLQYVINIKTIHERLCFCGPKPLESSVYLRLRACSGPDQ